LVLLSTYKMTWGSFYPVKENSLITKNRKRKFIISDSHFFFLFSSNFSSHGCFFTLQLSILSPLPRPSHLFTLHSPPSTFKQTLPPQNPTPVTVEDNSISEEGKGAGRHNKMKQKGNITWGSGNGVGFFILFRNQVLDRT